MKKIIFVLMGLSLFVSCSLAFAAAAAKNIELPAPNMQGGKPLMEALKDRHSSREYSAKELSLQQLSDLLWAGFGISREDGRRTAPSARNMQEIDIYVAKADGLYVYDARENLLEPVVAQDIREATGKQDFVKVAALNLVYVADYARMGAAGEKKEVWAALDTSFIAENVYLYCASEGLNTVVRAMFDEEKLKVAMKLRPDQKIILTQTVGFAP